MYKDSEVKDNLKFLDRIMSIMLKHSDNYTISLAKLSNAVPLAADSFFRDDTWYDKLKKFFIPDTPIWEKDFELFTGLSAEDAKLLSALDYLSEQKIILFLPQNEVKLTYSGIIMLAKGGFYKDYERQIWRDRLQKYAWIAVPLTFIAGYIIKPFSDIIIEYLSQLL